MEKDTFDKAQKIIDETGNYSISHLQRKLEIGYNRASKIMQDIREDLFSNEITLHKKMKYFLNFFTKEELLQCLKGISFLNENELRFSLNDEYFKIYISDNKLNIVHITFIEQESEMDGIKMISEEEVETNISKDEFLKILKG